VLALPGRAAWPPLQKELLQDGNVAACAPRLVHFGMVHRTGERPPPPPLLGRGSLQGGDTPFLYVLGVDPAREFETTKLRDWLLAVPAELRVRDPDAPLRPIGGREAILLGEERMRSDGLHPGDVVVLTSTRLETSADDLGRPAPFDREFAVAGAFRTRSVGYDGNTTFVGIDALRELLQKPADSVHEIAVRLRDPATTEATAVRLQHTVRRALHVSDFDLSRGPVAQSWRARNGYFLKSIEWQRELMKIILIVIMVVAAVLMFATLSMMVGEKTADIGILTALGGTPRGVMAVFLGCGLAITATGIVLGTILGCLSAVFLEDFRELVLAGTGLDLFPVKVYNLDRVPYELDPLWILQVACVAAVVGIVVSAVPAYRAARHDPLVSLRGV
jgi:lipoprotein-releasing system permease protein